MGGDDHLAPASGARGYRLVKKKVIVLGLDGLEPSIGEDLLERGELPYFRKIRDSGFYSRMVTTDRAQTPVTCSSFMTGCNPRNHAYTFAFL